MTIIQPHQFDLLARNVVAAQKSLLTTVQRLSSGRQIENPSDGPSDWFAGFSLGAERSQVSQAILNTRRADQVVSVAIDSISQIRSLVGGLRSLVVESQNRGARSDIELSSLESDVDDALEAIDVQRHRSLESIAGILGGDRGIVAAGVAEHAHAADGVDGVNFFRGSGNRLCRMGEVGGGLCAESPRV